MLHMSGGIPSSQPSSNSTYLNSEARYVANTLSDISHAWLDESSHLILAGKKTAITRNPWLAMLLLARDVQSNPGPGRSYPCTVCQRNVRHRDPSLSCDQYNEWSHTGCVNISDDEYGTLMEEGSFTLFCPRCTLAELPYPTSPEHDFSDTDSSTTTVSDDLNSKPGNALKIVNINVSSIKNIDKKKKFHAFLDDVAPDIII